MKLNTLLNNSTAITIAIIVILLMTLSIGAGLSARRISTLENEIDTARRTAIEMTLRAEALEAEAGRYREKIVSLESAADVIREIARKQDEELEKLIDISNGARFDVERARRTRTVATTVAELCEKLRELDHPCD